MEKFLQLREKHQTFVYNSYEILDGGFRFHFSMDNYDFYPEWKFEKSLLKNNLNSDFLNYLVFNLGMAELVSYWKAACPKTVVIKCGSLTENQCNWWKKLYFKGLSEFLYVNEINVTKDELMEIVPSDCSLKAFGINESFDGCLIPIGGGKDSIVTIELLKKRGENSDLCYIINPRGATLKSAETGGFSEENIIGVNRTIDKTLIQLNSEGYLNGHTPFSAIVAFSSYIFAYITGKKYIALSNESSANESNIIGTEINHQYSKSTEFEKDFRDYCNKYFTEKIQYFSFLRPLSEYQIAEKFTAFPKYFSVFQSCNVGSKTDTWCGKCAKCLYIYILLSAFLEDETLIKIIGNNMLDNAESEQLFNGLVYDNFDKPFECVGTKEEINLALHKAYFLRKDKYVPLLLDKYISKNFEMPQSLDGYFDEDNFVPKELLNLLK